MAGPGNPDGLPDLPPGWGPIVIPDDPAELAAEALLVRRELRQQAARHNRVPPGIGPPGPPTPPAAPEPPPLRLALIIMAIAVLTSLTSLFAIGWSAPQRHPTGQPAPPGRPATGWPLPALDVVDPSGATVPLRGLAPAVIMLTDGCDCAGQIAATAAAAPTGVTLVTLTSGAARPGPLPPTRAAGAPVRPLADPAGALRGHLALPPTPGTATVLLVGAAGDVVRVLAGTGSVEDYRAELTSLPAR